MPRPVEPKDLWTLRTPTSLAVSPDSARLAFAMTEPSPDEGKHYSHLFVISTDSDKAEPIRLTRGKHQNYTPRWWPDSRSIAFISDRNDRKQVWRIDLAGGEPEQLTDLPGQVQDFQIAPDGRALLLRIGEPKTPQRKQAEDKKQDSYAYGQDWLYTHLFWYDIDSRKRKRLTRGRFEVAAASLSPDSRYIAYIASADPTFDAKYFRSRLVILNRRTGKRTPIAAEVGRIWFADTPAWSPDSRHVVFCAAGPDELPFWQALMIASPGKRDARLLLPHLDRNQVAPEFAADGRLQFLVTDSTNVYLARTRLYPSRPAAPQPVSPERGVVTNHAVAPDGRAFFVHATSVRPPEIHVAGAATGRGRETGTRQLTHVNAAFRTVRISPARKIRYQSDGWTIEALLKTPRGKGPWPLILIPHGGPQGASSENFHLHHDLFVNRGWAVLLPNFRGSTGRGHEFLQRIIGDWGDGPMRDLMAGVDWCIEHGIADPKRLGIYGGSYGGYITTWTIGHTNRFKAAVAQCAVTNHVSMYGTTDIPTFMEYNLQTPPYKDFEKWWTQSPVSHVGRVRTPTLIITGLADERVHPTQSFEYYRHLKATGTPCDLVLYPREGHSITEPHHLLDLYHRVIAWFDKYLKRR